MFRKISLLCAGLFLCAILSSCGSLGYSLVLWNNSEAGVEEGQTVKVYFKSNISHSYIIEIPGTKNKVEIPLWQISEPESRRKTEKLAALYSDYAHTYASVKLDGLPIRAEAVNTSRQVYRLRKDEIIRVLYKGKGQAVTNGKGDLQGEWLRVLTEGGTEGWCFSYNLNLFERTDENIEAKPDLTAQEAIDEKLSAAIQKTWYPEEFSAMLSTGRFNLDRMDISYGFDFGQKTHEQTEPEQDGQEESEQTNDAVSADNQTYTARLLTADLDKSWTYSKITKNEDGNYQLDGNSVYITLRGQNSIAVQYMDSDGKLKNENFVFIEDDIQSLIDDEKARRNDEIMSFFNNGPSYQSSNYGTITFHDDGTAEWRGFNLLVPSIISRSARGDITLSADIYLSSSLRNEFDGILTFKFAGMANPVNFFYKKDEGGIRLEDAAKAQIRDNLVTARGTSPLVMYFERD